MVRNYESKGLRRRYTEEDKTRALSLFVRHKCVLTASMLSGVPSSTLYDWIGIPDRPLGTGRKCALKKWEEEDLVAIIVYTAENGIPMRRDQVKELVQSYMIYTKQNTANHPFGVKGKPGPDWMKSFERRHSEKIKNVKREGLLTCKDYNFDQEKCCQIF